MMIKENGRSSPKGSFYQNCHFTENCKIHQVFLKSKIMDNIHKYYYLIAFTAFMRYNHSHQYQGLVTEAIHWEM